jgi:hypothetical protein
MVTGIVYRILRWKSFENFHLGYWEREGKIMLKWDERM